MERGRGENEGRGSGSKKHKWWVEHRQGVIKDSIGNVEAKELICMTHGHELRWGNDVGGGVQGRGELRGEKNGTTVIA